MVDCVPYPCDRFGVQPKKMPQFGVAYPYDVTANFYDHDDTLLSFVIVKGNRIEALRLREDYNPNILKTPAEVWVGEKPQVVADWGTILATDTFRVPVFVKRRGKQLYTFVGDHKVLPRQATPAELDQARAQVPHTQGVSRIVFLKLV
jgi:hypothetical protein